MEQLTPNENYIIGYKKCHENTVVELFIPLEDIECTIINDCYENSSIQISIKKETNRLRRLKENNNPVNDIKSETLNIKTIHNQDRKNVVNKEFAKHRTNKGYVNAIYKNGVLWDKKQITSAFFDKTKVLYVVGRYVIVKEYDLNLENINGRGITYFLNKNIAENYDYNNVMKVSDYFWELKGIEISEEEKLKNSNSENKEKEENKTVPCSSPLACKVQESFTSRETATEYFENGREHKKYKKIDGDYVSDYVEYYENGNLMVKCTYNAGKIEGNIIEYHENGNVSRDDNLYLSGPNVQSRLDRLFDKNGNILKETIYFNSKKNGSCKTYIAGKLINDICYKNDKIDGLYIEYFDNGSKKEETCYMDELRHGNHISWFYNGNKKCECTFFENSFDGLKQEWFENGQLYEAINYKKGKLYNDYKKWYSNGNLQIDCTFENDKKNGYRKEYFKNEKLKKIVEYKNDHMIGEYKEYYENGNIKIDYLIGDDERYNGEYRSYHNNGKLESKSLFVDGEQEGDAFSWYSNGQLRTAYYYKNGLFNGKFKEWNENGNVIDEKEYINGQITNNNINDIVNKNEYYGSIIKLKK
jgi:antitoxin component YwqK of YwqJK toxin-antitoxin module